MRLRWQHIFQTLFVPGRDAEAREAGEGKRTLRLHATRSENDPQQNSRSGCLFFGTAHECSVHDAVFAIAGRTN